MSIWSGAMPCPVSDIVKTMLPGMSGTRLLPWRAVAAVTAAMPGIRPLPFGHIGDGNIHFNLSQPPGMDADEFLSHWAEMNCIVHDIVTDPDGSISAEHGIGRLKREEITRYKNALEIDMMRKVKAALDPEGIMNPGKVI